MPLHKHCLNFTLYSITHKPDVLTDHNVHHGFIELTDTNSPMAAMLDCIDSL